MPNIMLTLKTALVTLQQNPFYNALVILLSLFIGGLGVYITLRTSKSKNPQLLTKSTNIISDTSTIIPGLEVLYKDVPQDNITITKLLYWNKGYEPIRSDDIPKNNPIRILPVSNTKILSVELIYPRKEENRNNINTDFIEDEQQVTLTFDYLDSQEGLIIQVLHNGKKGGDLQFSATIIGSKKKTQNKFKGWFFSIFSIPEDIKDRKSLLWLCGVALFGGILGISLGGIFGLILSIFFFGFLLIQFPIAMLTRFPDFFAYYENDTLNTKD